jgi:hypothetical protein
MAPLTPIGTSGTERDILILSLFPVALQTVASTGQTGHPPLGGVLLSRPGGGNIGGAQPLASPGARLWRASLPAARATPQASARIGACTL